MEVKLRGHIPQLDGLRALAILPVLVTHSWTDYRSLPLARMGNAGWIGVDLFFVLSGFLITGILLDGRGAQNYFRNFYARRGLRIWPLYFAVLGFAFLVIPHVGFFAGDRADLARCKPIYYLLYLQNFKYGANGLFVLGVTWSLAVEEHFYLLWPWMVARVSRGALVKFLWALIAMTAVGRYFLLPVVANSTVSYLRFDEMAWGALAACWVRAPGFRPEPLRKLSWCGCWLIVPAVASILAQDPWSWARMHGVIYLPLGIGFMSWLGLALTAQPGSLLYRFLDLRVLRYTGKISYGMYLLHPIVMPSWALHRWLNLLPAGIGRDVLTLIVEFAAVYVVAALSWRFFESPILRLKARFATSERPVLATAA